MLNSQIGEFAFVALGIAERLGLIDPSLCKLILTTTALSMAVTPALGDLGTYIADKLEKNEEKSQSNSGNYSLTCLLTSLLTHFTHLDTITPVVTPASISDILETDIKAKNVAIEGLVESIDDSTLDFVLVCGYGRVGKMICDLLDRKFIRYIAIESNAVRAEDAKSKGAHIHTYLPTY